MKRYIQSKWFKALALMGAVLAAAWSVGTVIDKREVAKMTEKMQTVCVGRMLIDLPQEADFALYGAWIDGFTVSTKRESEAAFASLLSAREAEIRAKSDRLGGNNNMESVQEVKTGSGLAGKIFVHTRNVEEGTAAKGLELEHYRYESVALEGHVHAHGISVHLTAKDYDPDLIGDLPKLIDKLVANPTNGITAEPGFCIDRAYFRDPLPAEMGERIVLTAGLPSHRDIAIHFDTAAGTKPTAQGLIERNTENNKDMSPAEAMRFTRLRAAPRTIGTLTGDELLLRVVEENFAIIYGFRWEVLGTDDDVYVPELALKMVTGKSKEGPIPSSLSQLGALDLWDKIASSIRVRPTVAPKVSASKPPVVPLGTYAWAGDACVHSGWWQCSIANDGENLRVLGGERQYLTQGQRMPQALLLPPATLWQKMRGVQPSYETRTPTSWKLVDKRSRERLAPGLPLAEAAKGSPDGPGAVEQSAPVGSFAQSGIPCPASGWWRCEESHALDGTRWFALGSLLPAATFAVSPGAYGKTRAVSEFAQRQATWRLVRHAHAVGAGDDPG